MERKEFKLRLKRNKSKRNYRKTLELSLLGSIISLILFFYFNDSNIFKKSSNIDSANTFKVIDVREIPSGVSIKSKSKENELLLSEEPHYTICLYNPSYNLSKPPDNMGEVYDFIAVSQKPVLLKSIEAKYPEISKKAKIEGVVLIKILIDTLGNVEKTEILKSIPELDKAALFAAKQFKFKPAIVRGKLVKVWMVIPFKFKLN